MTPEVQLVLSTFFRLFRRGLELGCENQAKPPSKTILMSFTDLVLLSISVRYFHRFVCYLQLTAGSNSICSVAAYPPDLNEQVNMLRCRNLNQSKAAADLMRTGNKSFRILLIEIPGLNRRSGAEIWANLGTISCNCVAHHPFQKKSEYALTQVSEVHSRDRLRARLYQVDVQAGFSKI